MLTLHGVRDSGGASFMDLLHVRGVGDGGTLALALGTREHATIGRLPTCDLVIEDKSVSRVHASIRKVGEQHVLSDHGSSNGTFLNGLRLTPAHAFPLRPGDVIDIGTARLLYGQASGNTATPVGVLPPMDVRADRVYPVTSLLREGSRGHGGAQGAADQMRIERALEGVERANGIARCLEYAATALLVDGVALYSGERGKRLDLLATFPAGGSSSLGPLVQRSWADGKAHHNERVTHPAGRGATDTSIMSLRSALALPFYRRDNGCVVGLERGGGRRFDRAELAYAAVLSERLARTICIGAPSENDTPGLTADSAS
jgi:hypothetical protein